MSARNGHRRSRGRVPVTAHPAVLAMDQALGKERRPVYERYGATPIAQGELVRVSGIGTTRMMRFQEIVHLANGKAYVTVLDTVEDGGTKGLISVRPEQLSRVRNQHV